MKKLSLILIAIIAALAFACKTETTPNGNGNRNGTANNNQTPRVTSNDNAGGGQTLAGADKSVTITIDDDPANKGKCLITVSPDSIHLSKSNNQKIKWCIVNNSSVGKDATVTIYDFASKASGKKNPFGNGSDTDNTFDVDAANYNCNVKTKDPTSGEVGDAYKYNIKVSLGANVVGLLDPQVIIDD